MTAAALLLLGVVGGPADLSGLHELAIASGVPTVADEPVGFVELRRLRPDLYAVRLIDLDGAVASRGYMQVTPYGARVQWGVPYGAWWDWTAARDALTARDANGFTLRLRLGKR